MYGSAGKGAVGAGVVLGGGELAYTGGFGVPGIVMTVLAVGLVLGGVLMMRYARISRAQG
ncbi:MULTISPECIES: hypothetical protein [Kitasatospora]|uniref:hypothetical protein n=1 Tax=Kitasatospora TaxID=2063 RepID=UPI000B2F97C7|nr:MULTISPECIES: hypothetical protein [Kitasatospora]